MKCHDSCRGCMAKISPEQGRSDRRLTEKFIYCTQLESSQSSQDDTLPQHFCRMCEDTITICYRFIREARRVDLAMRTSLATVKSDTTDDKSQLTMIPEEIKLEQEEHSDECKSFNDLDIKHDGTKLTDEITIVKEETLGLEVEVMDEHDTGFSDDPDYKYEDSKEEDSGKNRVITEYERNVKNILAKVPKRKSKSDGSPIECKYCYKPFSTKIWYKKHLETVHADNTNSKFVCKLCSKAFSRNDILKQHMVTHTDERPHACHLCTKRFKMRKQLNLHLRMHEEQTEYICHVCNATFQWKAVLQTHMKIHFEEKKNLCHLCGAGFTLAGNLAVHMRTHTGEKPFSCARCSFRCSMSSSLRRHERTHTGARPHICTSCDKRFSDRGGLKRHMRTHTGELPYRCNFCSRAFIDSSKRKRHILSQHHALPGDPAAAELAATVSTFTHVKK